MVGRDLLPAVAETQRRAREEIAAEELRLKKELEAGQSRQAPPVDRPVQASIFGGSHDILKKDIKRTWPDDVAMGAYNQDLDQCRNELKKLARYEIEVRDIHMESKTLTERQEIKDKRENLEKHLIQVKAVFHTVTMLLSRMDNKNTNDLRLPAYGEGSQKREYRENTFKMLTKAVQEKIKDYGELRQMIENDYREEISRFLRTKNLAKPKGERQKAEQLEAKTQEMLQNGQAEVLLQQTLMTTGQGRAENILAQIEQQDRDVDALKAELDSLQTVFQEMMVMALSYHEDLGSIEDHVGRSLKTANKGKEEVEQAREYQKSAGKYMACAGLAVLIILGVALYMVFG